MRGSRTFCSDWGGCVALDLGATHADRITRAVSLAIPHPDGFAARRTDLQEQKTAAYAWMLAYSGRAAQLAAEFRELFPRNRVEYFVSYYDYYQPEAYIPSSDTFIEKDSSINEEIERLRISATSSLVSRRDVIVVASVSCIYGLGSPDDYRAMVVRLKVGGGATRDDLLEKLVSIHYERRDVSLERGSFRVRGDTVDIWAPYDEFATRVEFWGDTIESIAVTHPTSGEVAARKDETYLYPARHFVMPEDRIRAAVGEIRRELDEAGVAR